MMVTDERVGFNMGDKFYEEEGGANDICVGDVECIGETIETGKGGDS